MMRAMIMSFVISLGMSGTEVAASQRTVPATYFGQHFFYTAADLRWPGESPTRIPDSAGTWRLWDAYGTEWRYLEPMKGTWRFEYLDRYVEQAREKGIDLLLTLGQTPNWASARPDERASQGMGNAAEPRNLEDWSNYVRTIVQRYKGRIKAYEIWNEPAFIETDSIRRSGGKAGYFSGSVRAMVDLTKAAAEIIHEVDPQALVVSPGIVGQYQGLRRLEAFIKAGGGDYVDVIGFHFYLVESNMPEDLPSLVSRVRSLLTRYGLGSKPIWNTESGLVIQSPGKTVVPLEPNGRGVLSSVVNDDVAGARLLRFLVHGLDAGLERYYWFAWDSGSMGLLTSTKPRSLNKAGYAYAAGRRWLEGAEFEGCRESPQGVWRCRMREPGTGRMAELAWSTVDVRTVAVTPGLNYCERLPMGAAITPTEQLAEQVILSDTPVLMKAGVAPWEPRLHTR